MPEEVYMTMGGRTFRSDNKTSHTNGALAPEERTLLSAKPRKGDSNPMNYYALIYETVDDYVARRAEFREMHLRIAREARERGDLILAGAFNDPVDRALLVFRVDDKSKVEDFARKDP